MQRESSKQGSQSGIRGRISRRPKIAAVVAAGGQGTRIGASLPKQFLELNGKPILAHTVERLLQLENVVQVVVAVPAGHVRRARSIISKRPRKVPLLFVGGGRERQASVRCAVQRVRRDADLILVHDAVRPLIDPATIERVVDAACLKGAAVPGLPLIETIQRVSPRGWITRTPPREELQSIQTPQCFQAGLLRESLDRAARAGFVGTDESSVVRWAGHRVAVVPGSPDNIKITRPVDLEIAERLLHRLSGEEGIGMDRVGHGIDYHRLQEGRRLVLGGVEIPFEKGLAGHSDADVLSHAICDALLGAASLGDIGRIFPDSDPRHRDRSSLEFLKDTQHRLNAAGWTIRNIDATILAERPKLAPFFEGMKRHVARSLGVSEEQVSIKATTTEGMNAEGRGEGISAYAVALVTTAKR